MKNISKKIIAMFLIIVTFAGLGVGCSTKKEVASVSSKVADKVEYMVMYEVRMRYSVVGMPQVTSYVRDTGNNTFEVTGKVTIRDQYGDTYTGNYDATAKYNPETGNISVDTNIGKLYKNR